MSNAEIYLAALTGDYSGELPQPGPLRQEMYLAKMAGAYDGELPEPVTREDVFLYDLAVNGGTSGGGITAGIEYLEIGDMGLPKKAKFYGERVVPFAMSEQEVLTEAVLADGVKYIGEEAFCQCNDLETVHFPDGLLEIGERAFSRTGLMDDVTLPDSVERIDTEAFSDCSGMKLAGLPANLQEIGSQAFSDCYMLELSTIPSKVKTIGSHAFGNCYEITEITFEGTPDSIADTAFSGCQNLKVINVPWSKGAVDGVPWGVEDATVNHDYVK